MPERIIRNIQGDRVLRDLQQLAEFTRQPAVERVLFTREDLEARQWLKSRFAEEGLDVREDAIGNIFARWEGAMDDAPAVATGSHCDAIPHSGMYDGTLGVLGGLEAIRALKAAGYAPQRPIELIMFTAEEPTRFGIGCVGSRAMAGVLGPEQLTALRDADGLEFEAVRAQTPYSGDLNTVRFPQDAYKAFVELHIEQGPLLEAEGIPIGAVTAIAAPATLRFTLRGPGGHAGCVLMPDRHDPFTAACEIALEVEAAGRESTSADTVATVGLCQVHPGAVNSIPREVRMEVDIRDILLETRDKAVERVIRKAETAAASRGVEIAIERLNADPPALSAPEIVDAVVKACADSGFNFKKMISRAYHDSLFMARICPTGMIFVPCRNGISHRPEEFVEPIHIGQGVQVLAMTLATLASE